MSETAAVTPQYVVRETDGFAIAGLVLGLVGAGILAIIFSAIGLHRCQQNKDLAGRGLAEAGLVLGIVGTLVALVWFIVEMVNL